MTRTVAGRGEKSLLCDPGSKLRLGGREKREGEGSEWDGKAEKEKKKRKIKDKIQIGLYLLMKKR